LQYCLVDRRGVTDILTKWIYERSRGFVDSFFLVTISPTPYQPRSHNSFPHTLIIGLEVEGQSTMSSPFSASRKRYCFYPNLNLIGNTFLKATFVMSIAPYPTNLIDLGENKVTLL